MKMPVQRIEAVCANDESRYALQGVLFDAAKNLLIATDGRILAAIPAIPEKGDVTGLISLKAWKMARAAASRIPKKLRKTVWASFRILKHKVLLRGYDGTTVLAKLTGQFPQWEGVVTGIAPKMSVTFNVDLLSRLATALCEPDKPRMVTIFLEATDKAVSVIPEYGEGVGVMMPCRGLGKSLEGCWIDLGIKKKKQVAASSREETAVAVGK